MIYYKTSITVFSSSYLVNTLERHKHESDVCELHKGIPIPMSRGIK